MDKTLPILLIGCLFTFLCLLAFLMYMSFGYPFIKSSQVSQACMGGAPLAPRGFPPPIVSDRDSGLVPDSVTL